MMNISARIGQRVLVYTLAVLVVPMVVFPAQLGLELARDPVLNLAFEFVYYGLIAFILHRSGTLWQLVMSAGLCLVYRLGLGALFGLLIASVYSMNVAISLNLGMTTYLPVIIFQAAITPFVIKPLTDQFYQARERVREIRPVREPARTAPTPRPAATPTRPRPVAEERPAPPPRVRPKPAPVTNRSVSRVSDTPKQAADVNGFERAVRYIGEHGSVDLAAVVDDEGLVMSHFARGQFEAERWAPLALVFLQNNGQVLRRGHLDTPEKLDIVLKEKRIIVARTGDYSLMVMAERQSDDVLSIRINQGLEIVARYVAERYGDRLHKKAERVNVSGA